MDSRFYGRNDYITELDQLLEKVSLEQVNAVVKKHLQVDNMFITIITDDSESLPLSESLLNNNPSPMSYSNFVSEGLPDEVKSEDEEVAIYKLNVKSIDIVKSEDTFK